MSAIFDDEDDGVCGYCLDPNCEDDCYDCRREARLARGEDPED